ncbi:GIY-YIG nuclease family protein [Psychrobacter aestuarii]|uniref:Bacteriophage T5 Orf172 DNA-binding domain-containing protein n=1 Tax=Psychrobacter aestuarii TaxID=556327 RepID=A0ABP3FLK7_9GAMM|nr:GIY-YIG nuclease family protein [Psychrobacter aestuarii]
MNSEWWEDNHEFELQYRETLRQMESNESWIYIGVDIRYDNMAKIGLTTKALASRASSSQNPYYTLLCGFKIKEGVEAKKIHKIEAAIISFLDQSYERIDHCKSGKPSEWFCVNPIEVRKEIHDFLYEKFEKYMFCIWCETTDIVFIKYWENKSLLEGTIKASNIAQDLSSPTFSSDTDMSDNYDDYWEWNK